MNALNFFKKKLQTLKLPIFLKLRIWRSFWIRILLFFAWREGYFSFREVACGILPGGFQPGYLKDKQYEYIRAIADKIFFKNGIYQKESILLFNKPFFPAKEKTNVDSWLNFFILLFQIIVYDQYHLKENYRENLIIIDAGANIGIFSVMAASLCPNGKIYAFEPGSVAFKSLEKNRFFYKNIAAFNYGLGEKSGSLKLAVSSSTTANHVLDVREESNEEIKKENIRVVSIDDFVKENNVDKVDFIKIDTEGYEEKILRGAKETIKRFSPIIAVSAYHKPDDKRNIPKLVLSMNYCYKYKLFTDAEHIFIFKKRNLC